MPERPSRPAAQDQPTACTRCGEPLPARDPADPTAVRGYVVRPAGADVPVDDALVLCAACYLSDD